MECKYLCGHGCRLVLINILLVRLYELKGLYQAGLVEALGALRVAENCLGDALSNRGRHVSLHAEVSIITARPVTSIFDLPQLALLEFLSVWLSMGDVCRLDAAVSDELDREYWVHCLRECTFYGSRGPRDQYSKSALRWIWM